MILLEAEVLLERLDRQIVEIQHYLDVFAEKQKRASESVDTSVKV